MPGNVLTPFGNPDGSRADIIDIIQGFVAFGDSSIWGGLASKPNDLSARVIVGRKGSGKTVYLRRMQAFAAEQSSLYADSIQQGLPTTETIIKFCQWFPEPILTEKWMALWHHAILRAVSSHILYSPWVRSRLRSPAADQLDDYSDLLPTTHTPLSIYTQVSEIINLHHTRRHVTEFLDNPRWAQLEWALGEVLRDLPPLCFFLDAVDEEFAHAPMYWLRCQKGLFYQTMRLLRDSRLGSRLHIFICIRDIVLSSILRSEHKTRYQGEPHIRLLSWTKPAAAFFLQQKVASLETSLFLRERSSGSVLANWLGMESIRNAERNRKESIETYVLRHTRLLPRDVVILGNKLCNIVRSLQTFPAPEQAARQIRAAVNDAAHLFGDEQLIICGNHISSNLMPERAAEHNYSDLYTGCQEHIKGITDHLKRVVSSIGKDRFGAPELEHARRLAVDVFGEEADVFSVLWEHGLLGFEEGNRDIFYSETYLNEFNLPDNKRQYVLHACLIDVLKLAPIGRPVTPW